ncbi:MAG: hypothetical protein JKX91_00160 [Rhizobiaceae bacterium]|nr:hypothetical protein [Rhizobiaceae bacterium]
MAKIDHQAIMDAVLKEHKVVLDKDDPIMVTVTINRLILQRYITEVEKILEKNNEKQTLVMKLQLDQSKKAAQEIITKATDYASQQARQQFQEYQKELQGQHAVTNTQQSQALLHPSNRAATLLFASVCIAFGALFTALII